jgi:hypothetical protein
MRKDLQRIAIAVGLCAIVILFMWPFRSASSQIAMTGKLVCGDGFVLVENYHNKPRAVCLAGKLPTVIMAPVNTDQ